MCACKQLAMAWRADSLTYPFQLATEFAATVAVSVELLQSGGHALQGAEVFGPYGRPTHVDLHLFICMLLCEQQPVPILLLQPNGLAPSSLHDYIHNSFSHQTLHGACCTLKADLLICAAAHQPGHLDPGRPLHLGHGAEGTRKPVGSQGWHCGGKCVTRCRLIQDFAGTCMSHQHSRMCTLDNSSNTETLSSIICMPTGSCLCLPRARPLCKGTETRFCMMRACKGYICLQGAVKCHSCTALRPSALPAQASCRGKALTESSRWGLNLHNLHVQMLLPPVAMHQLWTPASLP